jgi:iron complex outermembrane receptor protein
MNIRTTIRTALSSILVAFLCVGVAVAQEKTVRGTVTDGATGDPLPGANVSIKGTTTGTTTDMEGAYEITVPGSDAVLVFSFVGYQRREVQVGDRTVIDVTLQEDVAQLDEVVVTGYGTQRRSDITGSVSSVDVAEANVGQNASAQELLRGRVSGLNVLENSGEPGSGVSVRIRGTTSISANSEPLYVIDGVPINNTTVTPGGASDVIGNDVSASSSSNPLASISPQDIKSIEVLKDASATAIYGSQGANGVVLIETKGGEAGSVQVDYEGKVSAGVIANKLDLLSADEYRQATGSSGGASTDWQDETLRTALTHEHNLSFSGGSEATTYRASLGYLDNEGILRQNGIRRVSGRINAQHSTLEDRLRFNLNLTASQLQTRHGFFRQGGGFQAGVLGSMIAFLPTLPVQDDAGVYSEYSRDFRNPVALQERITDVTDQERVLGNLTAAIDVLENLTVEGTVGLDVQDAIRRTYVPGSGPGLWIGQSSTNGGLGRQAERALSNVVTQTTVNYNRDLFDNQTFKLLGGFEYKRETFQELTTETENFITDATLFNNLGGGLDPSPPTSTKALVEQISFFGRANYTINDKYLLEATLRRDGSSVFGENEKFGVFPAASIGWRIAQEEFLQDTDWLTQLKLRFSWGISGNQAVPPYETLPSLTSSTDFQGVFGTGETVQPGVAQERAANPNLKWEQTQEFNVGLDFTAGRFNGSLNAYQKVTTDLLVDIPVLQPAVSDTRLENVGEVTNTGIEFNVDAYVFDRETTSLNVGANVSTNRNEITDLGDRPPINHTAVSGPGQTDVQAQRLEEGHPIGAFYGPVYAGTNEAGLETYETEDGGTTTNLSEARVDFIGNPVPDFSYGINLKYRYKSFDVGAFFRGEQGRELFNNTALEFAYESKLGASNIIQSALNDGVSADQEPVYSSRWVQEASFFRLDNLTIGYTLPNSDNYGLRRARIYASAQNVFVLTPYDGYDPEVNTNVSGRGLGFRNLALPTRGVDYTSYPRPRTFTVGIQLGL